MGLDRLLEADSLELRGQGEGELARHVRECPRCTAVAEKLLEGQAELAARLDEFAPKTEVDAALGEMRARRAVQERRAKRWRVVAPLAVAAALAGLFFLRPVELRHGVPGEPVTASARIEPLVEVPLAKNVMIFESRDRSVKVIWFYNGGAK
jgi:anti-sigma factor RsiW